jgi:ribose 5-phosphate isomerase RpiB
MDVNGQHGEASTDGPVLRWSGRVLSAEDLRRTLNGHREVILSERAVITPSAAEQLRFHGVRITRETREVRPAATGWGIAQQTPNPLVTSAVQTLHREGVRFRGLQAQPDASEDRWARAVAECIARGECPGGVVFCADAGLLCCVANKVAGLRAVCVMSVPQAARATQLLGANLVAVEMPGRTFFEIRQILRTVCSAGVPKCPSGIACTLQELDGHAHR